MISKECLCSQGGLFIASDSEGFKYRVNITINTNSNGLYRKENYKVLAFFFFRSSLVLLSDCRVFPLWFFFFQKKSWSNISEAIQTLLFRALWVPRLLLHGCKFIFFHTSKSLPLQTSPTPSSCVSRSPLENPLLISWTSLFTSHVYPLLSLCLYYVPTGNIPSLNPTLPELSDPQLAPSFLHEAFSEHLALKEPPSLLWITGLFYVM